ncbi:HCP-like protein [Cryphonectria parasitica EP155]|uniref:HCP-like protein n=1 Tax=Cryphonectria parasitica (strain ATCC 38755 / EP155) TaxID=660469 RepID=A0A9P4Y1F5_CRYP1|nr:HCP-like protein [Cryphonectria parasitica EP155]KAF3764400.1 HCP-like protein [Cryphonectria parasitica EP155]
MRPLWSLLLLLQALSPVWAEHDKDQTVTTPPPDIIHSHGESSPPVREPGADHVDAAIAKLYEIHNPAHHKRRKKTGVLGLIGQLAWKALPSLRASTAPTEESGSNSKIVDARLVEAVRHLEVATHKNNSDALFLLAQMNYYGNYSHPRDFHKAFDYYQQLASLNGNSSALYMVGLMYSTGVGDAVPKDQARALLYYTFAAVRGHTRAEMTVASRHWTGVGTPKSCETAAKYYKRVADKVMDWYRSGPPGGMNWNREGYHIADDFGGTYGEGASVSSSGINAVRHHPNSDAYAAIEDIIEYLNLMSNKGDFKSSFNLGAIYYEGQRGLERNLKEAAKYFFMVTKMYWKNGRGDENHKPGLDKYAAKAAGYLGRMYMRGEGVQQDFDRAKFWFERGLERSDAQSQYCLGLMMLHGYGIPKSIARATDLFRSAAEQEYSLAQVQLGVLFLDRGMPEDVRIANDYFELAARYGSIEGQYYLAEMIYHGIGRDKACAQALVLYKTVAERAEPLVSSWTEANMAYEDGDYELALLAYLHAAEEGYESAQNNVAYLLDTRQSMLSDVLGIGEPKSPALNNPNLALVYYTRSSRQGNIDSLVKMGDYYLDGVGVDQDVDKAVKCYTGAAEYQQSAQALFNLGWMHENGVGLDQDFHLAKRYYDLALATNEEAYLPVKLSLLKLRARSYWNTFTHGRINSIQDEPETTKDWSLSEWINNFVQEEYYYYDDGLYDDIYDDTMPGGDDPHYHGVDDDEGLVDTVIIMGIAISLAFFVYYRQQRERALQARRQGDQQQQGGNAGGAAAPAPAPPAQDNGGFFPPAGDPNFANWAAGGPQQHEAHAASDAVIKDLDRQLETARQARRIEEASARRRPGEAEGEEEEKEDEEDESEFNMAEMLLSLNIDSSLLGYDEEEEKWID